MVVYQPRVERYVRNPGGTYPANGCKRAPICLTDAQIQTELKKYIANNGLPRDLAHE